METIINKKVWVYQTTYKKIHGDYSVEILDYDHLICSGRIIHIFSTYDRSFLREYKNGDYYETGHQQIQMASIIDNNGNTHAFDLFQCSFTYKKPYYTQIFENGVDDDSLKKAFDLAQDRVYKSISDDVDNKSAAIDYRISKRYSRVEKKIKSIIDDYIIAYNTPSYNRRLASI